MTNWKPDGLSDNEVLSGKRLFLKANILTYLALWNVGISVTTFMRWYVLYFRSHPWKRLFNSKLLPDERIKVP